jgi:hypothetical protein
LLSHQVDSIAPTRQSFTILCRFLQEVTTMLRFSVVQVMKDGMHLCLVQQRRVMVTALHLPSLRSSDSQS